MDTDSGVSSADDKKKKKRKPKKKKKKTTAEESEEIKEALDAATSPVQDTITPLVSPKPSVQSPATPVSKKTPKPTVASPRTSSDPHGSTASLPISIVPSTAQSAHSYLGKEVEVKVKVKTRADPSTVKETEESNGFFSRFTGKSGKKVEKERQVIEIGEEENKERAQEQGARGVFQLPARARLLVERLLGSKEDEKKGQAGMRWGQFVKVRLQRR
jgi:hypothetical protein